MAINNTQDNLRVARDALKDAKAKSGLDLENLSSNLNSAAGLNKTNTNESNESSVSPESTRSGPSGP